jgi:hypothetical protein
MYRGQEHLALAPNTLVFYVDDSGDERLNDRNHPIFAFGGVSCVSEFHIPIAGAWQTMKRSVFPQVTGPLHAATHMREGKLSETKRAAVLQAMMHQQLGRFGTIMTDQTIGNRSHPSLNYAAAGMAGVAAPVRAAAMRSRV